MIHPPPTSTLFPYTTLFRSGIASALAGGAMSKLFGGGQKAASGGIQGDVLATDNNTVGMGDAGIKSVASTSPRSEERFSRNAETDLVCRLLLEKKKQINLTRRRGILTQPIPCPVLCSSKC